MSFTLTPTEAARVLSLEIISPPQIGFTQLYNYCYCTVCYKEYNLTLVVLNWGNLFSLPDVFLFVKRLHPGDYGSYTQLKLNSVIRWYDVPDPEFLRITTSDDEKITKCILAEVFR